MNEAYGCKSGYGTPIHVTLVPPFHLPEEYKTADLVQAIQKEVLPAAAQLKFDAHIDNFDAFGDRTIFAKVIRDEKWTALRDKVLAAVLKAAPGCTKKDQLHVEPKKARCRSLSFNGSASNTFQPHLTVANRDIPAGVSADALEVMNELNLVEDFPVDNITIFERKGGKWETAWSGEL